jgi:LysM repeat protein
MYVTNEAGKRYPLYMAPTQFEHSEVARFGYVDREGLKPIIGITGPGLRSLTFTHRIGSGDYRASIEHILLPLTDLAKRGQKVRFVGGSSAYEQSVWWRILDLPVKVEQRAADNRASRAVLTWTLEEAGSLPPNLTRTVPKPAPPKPVVKKAAATRTHRVVRGDTLWAIAGRYLGNPLRWTEIFALNRTIIKNPHWIYPGQLFRIPAR